MATYYTDYKNGNDTTGTGATGAPWKTLSKFLTACANGDTCNVRGNRTDAATFYAESGLSTAKTSLTIQADSGHEPIFVIAPVLTAWDKSGGYTNVYEKTSSQSYGVWNGETPLNKASSLANCDAVTNSWWYESGKTYVNIGGGDPDDSGGLRSNTTAARVLDITGAGLTWDGVGIQWSMTSLWIKADNCTVKNATFKCMNLFDGAGYGLSVYAYTGFRLENCIISNFHDVLAGYTGAQGVYLGTGSTNATITNCSISYCCNGVLVAAGAGAGHVVEDCTISELYRNGVDIAAGVVTVRRNSFRDCGGGALRMGSGATATVNHNSYRVTKTNPGPTGNNWGFILETGGIGTFYHNVAANLLLSSTGRAGFLIQQDASVGVFKNNISYNNATGFAVSNAPTLENDYNCAYGNTLNTSFPAGAHDVIADPLFVDSANGDFHLQPGSPCIDTGVAIAGINDGYNGAAPDIGRYETDAAGAPRQMMHYARMRQQ